LPKGGSSPHAVSSYGNQGQIRGKSGKFISLEKIKEFCELHLVTVLLILENWAASLEFALNN